MSYHSALCSLKCSHTGFLQKYWEGQVCSFFRDFAFLFPGPGTFSLSFFVWLVPSYSSELQTKFMSSERPSWPDTLNELPSLPMPISLTHLPASRSHFIYLFITCFYPLDHNLHESRGSCLSHSSECLDQALVHLNVYLTHREPKIFVGWMSEWINEWLPEWMNEWMEAYYLPWREEKCFYISHSIHQKIMWVVKKFHLCSLVWLESIHRENGTWIKLQHIERCEKKWHFRRRTWPPSFSSYNDYLSK